MLLNKNDERIGRVIRVLRQRRGWRQRDLAALAGVSRSAISTIERGRVDRYTIATIREILRALDGTVELYAVWGGHGDLDRLLDFDHARLVETWALMHRRAVWSVWAEASYNIFGERGRIDLLAFHGSTGTLEVTECKTGIWDVQDTAGRLDAKIRLAPTVAAEHGWVARRVVGALVIAEGRTARRRISQHELVFAPYDIRGRAAQAFVRDPRRPGHGVLAFVTLPESDQRNLRRAGLRRIRLRATDSRSPRTTKAVQVPNPGPATA